MKKKSGSKRTSSDKSGRLLAVRVKSAKGRKQSSTRWLKRQLNDPYVAAAQSVGFRSRAAFKLKELDDKFNFLKRKMRVIELGAAPGGWTQVIVNRLDPESTILAIDLVKMDPIPGAEILQLDFMEATTIKTLTKYFNDGADAVLSDMAPVMTGHSPTDHIRIMDLTEKAYTFAKEILNPGGCFVSKVFQGGTEKELLNDLKLSFSKVRHAKPPSSRSESTEMFVVAKNFHRTTTI